jgi:hypothetical protein
VISGVHLVIVKPNPPVEISDVFVPQMTATLAATVYSEPERKRDQGIVKVLRQDQTGFKAIRDLCSLEIYFMFAMRI